MNTLIKKASLFIAFVCMVSLVQAQKFGYINSQALLAEMAEVKEARTNLETLQKQLRTKGENMLKDLEAKFTTIQQQVERGELSPKQQEEQGQLLRAEEAKIAQYEQDMIKKIQEKETTLLQPILDRVNTAIKDVANENGYTFIFDQAAQIILYAEDSSNVTNLVKAKLGM